MGFEGLAYSKQLGPLRYVHNEEMKERSCCNEGTCQKGLWRRVTESPVKRERCFLSGSIERDS